MSPGQSEPRRGSRGVTFIDDDGMLWTVTERDGHDVPGTHGTLCLIFASDDAVRRVWDYPAGWRELVTSELVELSWCR